MNSVIDMTQRQAADFARSIFADIAAYCASHEAEYKEFLAGEGRNDEC